MKYETAELTALTPAVNAIQSPSPSVKISRTFTADSSHPQGNNEALAAYADWE